MELDRLQKFSTDKSLSNEDLDNPVETIYMNAMKSRAESLSTTTSGKQTKNFNSKVASIVHRDYYSVNDIDPEPVYYSSCDESDDDNEDEIESDIILQHPERDPPSIDHLFSSRSDESEDASEGDLELRPLKKGKKENNNSSKNPYKDFDKPHVDEFCFLCEWDTMGRPETDKVSQIVRLIEKSYYTEEKGKIARSIHLLYMSDIYPELIKRGYPDVKIWRSKSVLNHILSILDPRIQLFGNEIHDINKELKCLKKMSYAKKTTDGHEEWEVVESVHKLRLQYIKMKVELFKLIPSKLAFFNEKSLLDPSGAGAVIKEKIFSMTTTTSTNKKKRNII